MKINDPLIYAIDRSDCDAVEEWISKGNDARVIIEECGYSLFYHAVLASNCAIIELLAKSGADLTEMVNDASLYLIPIERGQIEIVRIFISYGLDVNINDPRGYTPLTYASMLNQLEIAALLTKNGGKKHLESREGAPTPPRSSSPLPDEVTIPFSAGNLSVAIFQGKINLIKHWMEQGNVPTYESLYQAAIQGQQELFDYFLTMNVDINVQDEQGGDTLLHHTVYSGRINMVKSLLLAGANINILNNEEETPYFIAERLHHHQIAELIKSQRVPKAPDWEKFTTRVVEETAQLLKLEKCNLKTLYCAIALQRQQYQVEIHPFDRKSQHFGCLTIGGFTHEVFQNTSNDKVQMITLNWLSSTVERFIQHSDFTSPFLKIRVLKEIPAEYNKISKESRALIRDSYLNIFEIKLVYNLEDKPSLELTTFYYFQYSEPAHNVALMIYPYQNKNRFLSTCFGIANNIFKRVLAQDSPQEFLQQVAYLLHLMPLALPTARGNASIMEMLTQAIAAYKGWKINDLNKPTEEEIRWDFKSFITPDPKEYAAWFVNGFKDKIVNMEAKSISPWSFFRSTSEASVPMKDEKKITSGNYNATNE